MYLLIFSDKKVKKKYKHAYIRHQMREELLKRLHYYFINLYTKTFCLNMRLHHLLD